MRLTPRNLCDRTGEAYGSAVTEVEINSLERPAMGAVVVDAPTVVRLIGGHWRRLSRLTPKWLVQRFGSLTLQPRRNLGCDMTAEMSLAVYSDYASQVREPNPLYLHWRPPAPVAAELWGDFHPPEALQNWFERLPAEIRPAMRWLIMGPVGSGTRMHVDIFGTSAWNLLIQGYKQWVFLPPDALPTHQCLDIDAFCLPIRLPYDLRARAIRCLQGPGDLVVVPAGWWHQVHNLTPVLAVTENYVNTSNVAHVRAWFHERGMHEWERIIGIMAQ